MFEIAVPSVTRRVLIPSASEQAIASLPPSVMKTPASPASSAALVHSISVGGGESGSVEKASAIFAISVIVLSPKKSHKSIASRERFRFREAADPVGHDRCLQTTACLPMPHEAANNDPSGFSMN